MSADRLLIVLMAVLMLGVIWLVAWAVKTDPAGAPPLPVLGLILAIPAVVIVGVAIALAQRLREIGRREEDDARRF